MGLTGRFLCEVRPSAAVVFPPHEFIDMFVCFLSFLFVPYIHPPIF